MQISADDLTLTYQEEPDRLRLHFHHKTYQIDHTIRRSQLMHEWIIALPPVIYKSILRHHIVLHNKYCLDFDSQKWWFLMRSHSQLNLTDDIVSQIAGWLTIPDDYHHEICGVLDIDHPSEITSSRISEKMDRIPRSVDVSKWRFLRTGTALVREEFWKGISDVLHPNGNTATSIQSLCWGISQYLHRGTEYAPNAFRKAMINRKVVMPMQVPTLLENNLLCMTDTPQSEKAGKIASLPIRTMTNEQGYIVANAVYPLSLTACQCPFPQRLGANREVVLRAVSQAMLLEHPDIANTYSSALVEGI